MASVHRIDARSTLLRVWEQFDIPPQTAHLLNHLPDGMASCQKHMATAEHLRLLGPGIIENARTGAISICPLRTLSSTNS